MTVETLASMLKDCPDKSVTIQFDKEAKRFVVAVDGEGQQEVTRSASLVTALQVASESLTVEG